MKTLTEYMAMSYRMEIVEDKDEGGFVVSYPEFAGMYYLWGNCRKCSGKCTGCKKTWFEAALEESVKIHEPVSLGGV